MVKSQNGFCFIFPCVLKTVTDVWKLKKETPSLFLSFYSSPHLLKPCFIAFLDIFLLKLDYIIAGGLAHVLIHSSQNGGQSHPFPEESYKKGLETSTTYDVYW